jgi:hypothetical protein
VLVEPAIMRVEPPIVLIQAAENGVKSAVMLVESAVMTGHDPSDFGQKLVDRRDVGTVLFAHSCLTSTFLPPSRYAGGLCSKNSMSWGRGFQCGLLGHSLVRPDISFP